MFTLRIARIELGAERWTAWHPSAWMLATERLPDGSRLAWCGPFHFAACPLTPAPSA